MAQVNPALRSPRRRRPRVRRWRILITAGPTREYIDPVRFISNASSGKMAVAIAAAARARGHEVVMVCGPMSAKPPRGVTVVPVVSARDMLRESRRLFRSSHAAIFAAAVSDYRPARPASRKRPKPSGRFVLPLTPNPDIAAELGRSKGRRVTVVFALEDHDGRRHAEAKLRRKHANAIVLNGPAVIHAEKGRIEFKTADGRWEGLPVLSKAAIGRLIVRRLEALLGPPTGARDRQRA